MGNEKKMTPKDQAEQNIFGPALSVFGLPVDRNIIFSNHKNVYRKKIETRQRKLIVKISFLKFFLHSDENLLLLTTGYSPTTFWELLLTFPMFFFFKRALLVFTTKRIFHIPTSFGYAYRQTISQIRYSDCHRIQTKGRLLVLDCKNGQKQVFSDIAATELKKIKQLIPHLPIKEGLNPDTEIQSLCPSCANGLPEDLKECPKCSLRFKSRERGIISSILVPGGGFFYSRHPIYGLLMGVVELAIIASIILAGLYLNPEISQNKILLMTFMAIILISVKALNAYHTNMLIEYPIPKKREFDRRKV